MKPNFVKGMSLDDLINRMNSFLTSLGIDNFRSRIVSGTTSSTPDTKLPIAHGLNVRPSHWEIQTGRIYLPDTEPADNQFLDVRSGQASEPFSIRIYY